MTVTGVMTTSVIKVSSGSNNSGFTYQERSGLPSQSASKAHWRTWASTQQITKLPEASALIVHHLATWIQGGSTVLTFLPMQSEVDLTNLGQLHLDLVVTRTPDEGWLTLHGWDEPREHHRWGFENPTPESETFSGQIDVALIPGVAFDESGQRLGHGRGYYDELLSRIEPNFIVGVSPASLVVPRLPTESHDIVMTHLVTELGIQEIETESTANDQS